MKKLAMLMCIFVMSFMLNSNVNASRVDEDTNGKFITYEQPSQNFEKLMPNSLSYVDNGETDGNARGNNGGQGSTINPLGTVSCGNSIKIPAVIPNLVSYTVLATKLVVPSLLIILGLIDLAKAVVASDEEKMKKSQKTFIKRIIIAVTLFFIVSIITWIFSMLGSKDPGTFSKNSIVSCINCFVRGADSGYCIK